MEQEENKKKATQKDDPTKKYDQEYPENGDNFKAGGGEKRELPNNPAENAEREKPDDDDK